MIAGVILSVALLLAMFWALGAFKRLMQLRKGLRRAFGQVDEQFNRRYQLIPRLVESLAHSLLQQRTVLDGVTEARHAAVAANAGVVRNPADSSMLRKLADAENVLTASLACMLYIDERSGNAADNPVREEILREFADIEVRIAFAAQIFNEEVEKYNSSLQQFPSSLIAGLFRFGLAEKLAFADAVQVGPNGP